ncbi:hypothetical protein ACH5AU_15705 [Streptomyces albidoflavus]|nr:hypothetical protein [Streptomyces sp. L06]
MHDLAKFLTARIADDHHVYAYVAHTFGGEALLDSHLPLLDLTDVSASSTRSGLSHPWRQANSAYTEAVPCP